MKRQLMRMFFSGIRGSNTIWMASDLMELFGLRRRRKSNGSFLTTALGAGAIAYGLKKMLEKQEQNGNGKTEPRKEQNHAASTSTTGISEERKSAIRNIIYSYSKNDPGLRAALQEFSTEFDQQEPNGEAVKGEKEGSPKSESATDWQI